MVPEDDLREENQRLKNEIETILLELQKIIEVCELKDSTDWGGYDKLKSIWLKFYGKNEERNRENYASSPYRKNRNLNKRELDPEDQLKKETLIKEKAELEVIYNFLVKKSEFFRT